MAERLWVKLWVSWYTSASHGEVSADAVHVGPVLMTLVRWTPGVDDGFAEFEGGRPMLTSTIAKRAKWTLQRTEKALAELESVGTVVRREDGAWGFPKYGQAQETPDAARKRRVREAAATKVRGQSADTEADSPGQVEAEAEAELTPPTPSEGVTPAKPKRPRKAPRQLDSQAELVLARIDEHLVRWGELVLSPSRRTDTTILALLRTGATVDELLTGVDARAWYADSRTDERGSLNATTPFGLPTARGNGGWSYTCRLVDMRRRATQRATVRTDWTPPGGVTEAEQDRVLNGGRDAG